MKPLFTIQGNAGERITYYLSSAFLITLPFDRFYSQLILGALLVHVLIHFSKGKRQQIPVIHHLILVSVFLLGLAGLLYSPDQAQAWKDLVRQLAIFIFPIIFTLSTLSWQKYRHNLLMVFGLACVATIIYLYLDTFRVMIYYNMPPSSLFSQAFINHNFSSPIGLHATYLSMFAAISIVFFTWTFLQEKVWKNKIALGIALIILSAGMLQLASRSALIGLAAGLFSIVFFLPKVESRRQFLALIIGIACITVIGILNIDSFRTRYVSGLREDLDRLAMDARMSEPRAARWELAWQLIAQKIMVGHGSGTEKKLLKDAYFENRYYNSYLHELNAHNQYLSIWLKTGIVGLVIYLGTLLFGFLNARKNTDPVFFAFMLLISVVGFSENLLDVNKGIFFYAFFFSLFVYSGKPFFQIPRLDRKNPG
jgi:O-antigen ligase